MSLVITDVIAREIKSRVLEKNNTLPMKTSILCPFTLKDMLEYRFSSFVSSQSVISVKQT